MTLQTLKGFRDFLPDTMAIRSRVISILEGVFQSYGFSPLQTPTLEYAAVLTGKYGEEAEKLMYLFTDPGGRQVGLNYDLTVPLARIMSQYPNLSKPFKRYQIQPAYRAENTQKGRYRQFTQCDIDTTGSGSPLADAEIIAVVSSSLKALGFPDFTIRINSRQILFELMVKAGIPSDKSFSVLQSIDKLDKKSEAEVSQELASKSISPMQISELFTALELSQADAHLREIMQYAESLGVTNLQFDPRLVRGLDYYTGAIFETVVTEPKIGSITGGGRYDQLIKNLGGPDLPAVGTTIGLDRICDVISDLRLWSDLPVTPTRILVTIFTPDLLTKSLELSKSLRDSGIATEVFLDPTAKLDKQLKYASQKSIPYVAILGPDEISQSNFTLKKLADSTQTAYPLDEISDLKSLLS